MPVRPRRARRHRRALTLRLELALTLGPSPGQADDLSDDLLREVYLEHRDRLLAHVALGARPWGWWRFEADVPEALREVRPVLVPVEAADAHHTARRELEQRRAAWLAEHTCAAASAKGARITRGNSGQVPGAGVCTPRAGRGS